MKMKTILCLTMALGICSQAMALEIYKGKILSQKVWSTHGEKARLASAKNRQHKSQLIDGNVFQASYAQILSRTAKVDELVSIENNNALFVDNNTDEEHEYRVMNSVCSDTDENTTHCIHYFKTFVLSPGGYLSDDMHPVLDMTYSKAGSYRIAVFTSFGPSTGPASYNTATATVTVS